MYLVNRTVIANAVGRALSRARGLSIYFPTNKSRRIDKSYEKTDFARDCPWIDFLKEYLYH